MAINKSFPRGVYPITVVWRLELPDGTPYSLEGISYELFYRTAQGDVDITTSVIENEDRSALTWTLTKENQFYYGVYTPCLRLTNPSSGNEIAVITFRSAFQIDRNPNYKSSLVTSAFLDEETATITLTTVGQYDLFSKDVPIITAGSDGFLRTDGAILRDDQNVPVRWKPNIVVVDEIPSAEDAEESVIYRKIEGQSYTDYALTEGDVKLIHATGSPWTSADFEYDGEGVVQINPSTTRPAFFWKKISGGGPNLRINTLQRNPDIDSQIYYNNDGYYGKVSGVEAEIDVVAIESGRLIALETRVAELKADTDSRFDNLSAEEVAYEGLIYANNVKEALENLQSFKASNSDIEEVRDYISGISDALDTKADETQVSSIQSTLGRHSSRMDTIDANLGSLDAGKADKTQLSPINSAISEHTQKIYEVTSKVNNLSANQVQYSGSIPASNVKEAIDNVVRYKAEQSQVDTLDSKINTKQEKLVSGSNIKTINGQTILGSGNIEIQGGGSDVTRESIINALGYTPADNNDVYSKSQIDSMIIATLNTAI